MINFVKQKRKERHISQEQLAEMAGVSQREISKIELEQLTPTMYTAKLIAKALGMSSDDLFFTDEEAEEMGLKAKKTKEREYENGEGVLGKSQQTRTCKNRSNEQTGSKRYH